MAATGERERAVKPLLVNKYERTGDEMLRDLEASCGDRLCMKVRLADVVDVDDPTVCDTAEKSYALRAHLDFVFVDQETSEPRFVVELDGAHHRDDPKTRQRDAKKDALCARAGLPLLRVSNTYLGSRDRIPFLGRIAETFYLAEAFAAGQLSGAIPMDEVYDASAFPTYSPVDEEARRILWDSYKAGHLRTWIPNWVTWRDRDDRSVSTLTWIKVDEDRWVRFEVKIGDFDFNGIVASELSEALATIELAEFVRRWIEGMGSAYSARSMQATWDRVNEISHDPERSLSGGGSGDMGPFDPDAPRSTPIVGDIFRPIHEAAMREAQRLVALGFDLSTLATLVESPEGN